MSDKENLDGPFGFQCFKCVKFNKNGIKVPVKITLDSSRVFTRKAKNGRYQLVGIHGRHYAYKFTSKDIYLKYKKTT